MSAPAVNTKPINRIQVTVHQGEAVLIRVIGVVQRRGFDVRWMDVRPTDKTLTDFVFTLDVQSERDVDLLCRQITRVHDVTSVRVLERDLDDVVEALEVSAMPGSVTPA